MAKDCLVYGFFHGGDPRDFTPDGECCSPDEIEAHAKACALFNEAEAKGEPLPGLDCESGWMQLENGAVCHVLRSSFGIGTYVVDMDEVIGEQGE